MANQKHLLPEQRITIQEMLGKRCSFTEIGSVLDKDPSTISKEIRKHLDFSRTGYRHIKYNACKHRLSCTKVHYVNSSLSAMLLQRIVPECQTGIAPPVDFDGMPDYHNRSRIS